jgi:hypothetical protein
LFIACLIVSPKFLEFFARDITEQSSRYLKHGTFEYEAGARLTFPPHALHAPTTQLFLRGNFEHLSLALYGRIAHEYILPQRATQSQQQAKPKTEEASKSSSITTSKNASASVPPTASVNTQPATANVRKPEPPRSTMHAQPVQPASVPTKPPQHQPQRKDPRLEEKELRERQEREALQKREAEKERQRQTELESLRRLHARFPPLAFTVYTVLGEESESEDRTERWAPLHSLLFARKGCMARAMHARLSQEEMVARFVELCGALEEQRQEETMTTRERVDKTLDSLKALDLSELDRMLSCIYVFILFYLFYSFCLFIFILFVLFI